MKAKRIFSGILAVATTVGCLSCMVGCQTSKPKVQMQITFQEETYTLNYTLYRQVAPATVEHFITLAENGYYDGVIVHDYQNSRMYTGAYVFGDASVNSGLEYKKYYDIVKNYKYFPVSVYSQGNEALYTLCGEFEGNNLTPEKGEKKETFGSLTMYYTDKKDDVSDVIVKHPQAGQGSRNYKYNSATSQFFISLTGEDKTNTDYCTFATLNDDSTEALLDLQTAIEEYLDGNLDALEKQLMRIDEDDPFVGTVNKNVTYNVLQESVTITKVTVKSR
jgi:cyclophilin family peptidyl-prolyl cis-trans isomerase